MAYRRIARFLRDEHGESLVGFALTLPILLGFMFGMMQVCLLYYTYEMISESAREGTRYAIVHGSTCQTSTGSSCTVTHTQIETYVKGLGWTNPGGGTINPTASFPDGDQVPGHRVQVTVTYSFPCKIPWVTNQMISLSSSSEMYIIQ
jgi:Flp pilus assembly protein TadG